MRHRHLACVFRVQLLVLALLVPILGYAQTSSVQPRVTQTVDERQLTVLRGNTHPLAKAKYDQGAVADSQATRRMLLLLRRSPDQESALRQLLDQQQSKASGQFHQWLTPQQFGERFGPADADIQAVTSWLESHGFQINRVAAGRILVEFSGTAGQVRDAFHTEIHRFVVNGEEHFANATDPQIPAALTPVVAGPVSLTNFKKRSQLRNLGAFRRTNATGQIVPLAPLYSFGPCTGTIPTCNAVGPGDFAAIYGVNGLYSQGIDGTGQTIAIVGDSEICTASSPDFSTCNGNDDAATYRSQFGLSTSQLPHVIVDGPDPGFNNDETEGDLDTQLAGAVARNATIDFVIAADTESTAGIDLAAEYIVDNNLAPVLSESFGACEPNLGTNGNLFYATLWEQAAAQGITVVISTGDAGSAGCDDENTEQFADESGNGFGTAVNGIGSTPFNVAAGGTDFDITQPNYEVTYWSNGVNSTVNGINNVSATTYIPETTWNDSCAQNFNNVNTTCTSANLNSPTLNIVGGGGGQSNCSAVNTTTGACEFYMKPPWQAVASGSLGVTMPTDPSRDVPDVSLFSADGFVSNSFHVVCQSDQFPGGAPCDIQAPYFQFIGVGGTSSAAPAFAGIMALINQKLSQRQGQADYVLYNLANFPGTFNDVTKGNNSVPCAPGSFNCSVTNPSSPSFGVLDFETLANAQTTNIAFTAGTGFDLATGLGSVNAATMAANWATAEGQFTPTTTTLCLSTTSTTLSTCVATPIVTTHGSKVYVNIGVTPSPGNTRTEDAALVGTYASGGTAGVSQFTSNNYVVANQDIFSLTNGMISGATTTHLIGGSYTVAARYAGDGTFGSSTSTPGISVTVNPEGSTATQSIIVVSPSACVISPSANAMTFVPSCAGGTVSPQPYGSAFALRVDVVGSSGQENATGNVVISGLPAGFTNTYPLNAEGYTEVLSPGNFGATTGTAQIPALPPGNYSFTSQYCGTIAACGGDPSYSASAVTPALAFTVTQGPTQTTLTPSATIIAPGSQVTLTAFVDTVNAGITLGSIGNAPTGTITFMNSATMAVVGTAPLTATTDANGYSAAMASLPLTPAGTASYVAVFAADGNYTGSTSSPVTVTVTTPPAPTVTALGVTMGAQGANMIHETLTGTNFQMGTGSTTISFSGSGITVVPGSINATSSTSLSCTFMIAAGATPGPQNVFVTTAGGKSAAGNANIFTVDAAPTLSSLSQPTGAQGGMVMETLTGANFVSPASITFSGTGVSISATGVTVVNSTTITATFAISGTAPPLPQTVFVTSNGVTTSNVVQFTAVAPPTLTMLSVTSGVQGTTTPTITLTGTNFASPATVTIGGNGMTGVTATNVQVTGPTTITANFMIAANATLGAQNVTVTSNGVTTSPPLTFTVNPPAPTVTSFSPAGATFGSNVLVTITGTNFVATTGFPTIQSTSGVNIGVSSINVMSSTMMTAMFSVPAGPSVNNATMTVTTAGGTSTLVFGVGSDFGIAANPTTQMVTRGMTGTTTLTLTPTTANAPFPATVNFTVTGLPTETTCTLALVGGNPAACGSFSLPASAAVGAMPMVTLTITTTAPSLVAPRMEPGSRGPLRFQPLVLLACAMWLSLLLTYIVFGRRAGQRTQAAQYALAILLVMAMAGLAAACGGGGGGGSSGPPPNQGSQPTGPNNITVTATSGNASHMATYTPTLQ